MESRKTDRPAGSGVTTEPEKKKLSAREILADIRKGISDRDFEQKYHLTPDGREKVFRKLIATGHLTEAELHRRSQPRKNREASGNLPASQAGRSVAPVDTTKKPSTPTQSVSTTDRSTSPTSSLRKGIEKGVASQLWTASTFLKSFSKHDQIVVGAGAILGGICAAVVTTYWGTTKTWTGWLSKSHGTASWKWIIGCAIIGAVLAFALDLILKKRRNVGTPKQPLSVTHTPGSAGPVSAEEIEKAITIMEKARRDMFGIAGDIGVLAVGAAGGGIAAVAVAAFFDATSIWGVTTAGKWLGLSVRGSTPWTWIIGCAIAGAVLAFSVSRLVASGAGAEERKKRNIDELKKEVEKRRKAAEKSDVDKEKFGKLQQSLTMLLSNGKITPEESTGLIEGIKSGGTSYEFAFGFIEELLQE